MRTIRRILALTTIVGAVAALLVVPSAAQARDPDPPCEWEPGGYRTHSTCDERDSTDMYIACWPYIESPPYAATIHGPGGVVLARIELRYNRGARTSAHPGGECRVAYAALYVWHEHATGCYAKVERTSDGQAYRTSGYPRNTPFFTPVVYDANVTSYAWGRCEFFGQAYSAGTPSY